MMGESVLNVDVDSVLGKLEDFLREQISKLDRAGAVVGLSGGIDSSVSAALAARALGHERVLGLIMPERDSHPQSKRDAVALAKQLRIPYKVFPISRVLARLGVYRSFWHHLVPYHIRAKYVRRRLDSQLKERGRSSFAETLVSIKNRDLRKAAARHRCKPRIRMVILYSHAERHNYAVLGTTNRSEYLTGFFTKYGDAAADVEPLIPLYKTQVRQLARILNLPPSIISKAPSSDVVPGITDEQRLNLPYSTLDKILYCCEEGMSDSQAAEAAGVEVETVEYVRSLMRNSSYRRDPPAIPSWRAAGGNELP